jgi:hypothetical protein
MGSITEVILLATLPRWSLKQAPTVVDQAHALGPGSHLLILSRVANGSQEPRV